jgi:hypothetical protein
VILRTRHLREDRLFDCYQTERSGEPLDPRVLEHLADCAACAARYGDLTRFMDHVRFNADTEIDTVFSPERLHIQQQQILRRVDHLGHAARVISFPGQGTTHHMPGRGWGIAPRWIAGAAAAGLFIGIYVGTFFVPGRQVDPYRGAAAGIARIATSPAPQIGEPSVFAAAPEPATDDADAFLLELEVAVERPHTQELIALDELTPHVREVRASLR